VSDALRKSARNRTCKMNAHCCNGNRETTVWCHSNFSEHGKGLHLKAKDIFGFDGCSSCHEYFDIESRRRAMPRNERLALFYAAFTCSIMERLAEGWDFVKVKVENSQR